MIATPYLLFLGDAVEGLAAKVAQKFGPERYNGLNAEYQTKLLSRLNSENEGDVNIGYRAHGWSRRRRH